MVEGDHKPDRDLRRRAERQLGLTSAPEARDESQRLIHELEILQVELEMQCDELQRAQHEASISHAAYEALYHQAPVGYFTCNRSGRILQANASLATLLGTTVAKLAGASFPAFAASGSRDAFHHLAERLEHKAVGSCEMQIQTVDGDLRDVRLDSRAEHDDCDGRAVRLQVCVVDRTEQKRTEAQVSELRERNQRHADQLRISKLESLGVLAGGIAHDFNNLLTGILANIGLARDAPREADAMLAEAEAATRRAAALTQQLLTFAKGGAPIKKVTPIHGIIRQTAEF